MIKKSNQKGSWIGIVLQIFVLLLLLILVIIFLNQGMLTEQNALIVFVLIGALAIPVVIAIKNKLKKEPVENTNQAVGPTNNGQTQYYDPNRPDQGSGTDPNQPGVSGKEKKPVVKTDVSKKLAIILPAIVLLFSFWYVFFKDEFPLFSVSVAGRWVDDVDPNDCGSGIICETEYWYIEFDPEGTFDIGWKNPGYAEESQGSGTWTQSGSEIFMAGVIGGSYGEWTMVIRGNKMYNDNGDPSYFQKE